MIKQSLAAVSLWLSTSLSLSFAAPVVLTDIQGYGFDEKRQLTTFSTLIFDDESGKILARGDASLAQSYPAARSINGQGKTLLPGLIDGHGHILGLGQNLSQVELRGTTSEQAAVAAVAEFAAKRPERQWILGRSWNQVLWPGQQFPTKALLDEAVNDKSVWLRRVDGHAGWANSKALALAGITRDTIDPPGGEIIRDAQGNPTGVLIDNAMRLVQQHIPQQSDAEYIAELQSAFRHLLSLGITSVHDAGVRSHIVRLYQQLQQQHELPLRIYVMLSASDTELPQWLENGIIDDPQDLLEIRAVKLMADGALGSRGAALIEPYSDQPEQKGLLVTTPDRLTALLQVTLGAGFQANIHAIGDLANRIVLDNFEKLLTAEQRLAGRHRIEHAQVIDVNDLSRFAQLHILPSMQATHATSDMNMAGNRLGVARLRGAYAWRTLVDQGNIIVGGSDFPVELPDPFHGIHASVTRQDHNNQPVAGWIPEQRLTLEEALRSFTVDAAYGAHQEQTMGTLAPGSWADFILIDRNIFTVPAEQIWQTQVEQTWLAGKQVFSR